MATTIDHLRVDHRVTVLRDFTDAAGITMKAGQGGILRGLSFDQLRMEIQRRVNLVIAPAKCNAVLIEEMLIN